MGNKIANFTSIVVGNKEPPTPDLKELSARQIEIIKETWAIPYANPEDSGEIILYTYFERFPENQQKFAAFRNTPLVVLRGTPGFRGHAHKIMNVIASAIDALGTEEGLKMASIIVKDTAKYHKRRAISKRSFVDLRSVVLEVVSDVCKLDEEGKVAWNNFFDTVYHIVFNVLDEAKKGNKK